MYITSPEFATLEAAHIKAKRAVSALAATHYSADASTAFYLAVADTDCPADIADGLALVFALGDELDSKHSSVARLASSL